MSRVKVRLDALLPKKTVAYTQDKLNGMIVGLKNNCSALLKAARQAFIDFPNEVSVFEFTDSRQTPAKVFGD